MVDSSENTVERSTVGGDSIQIGHVHGDVTIVGAAEGEPGRRRRLPGLIRVRDADPVRLGVHKPIRVAGSDGAMPAYVSRDLDMQGDAGLRVQLLHAAAGGGFLVLVGGSSVGKTRSLYEAVNELLPAWELLHPADAGQIGQLIEHPHGQLVVWLDELQNYLDGRRGLTAAMLRDLFDAAEHVVVVATLWPDYYDAYVQPHRSASEADRYAHERELLKLANVIHVGSRFTAAEQRRAQTAAADDARLRLALESGDFGLTQVIAAAPQLINRWSSAGPYARAILTAAIDATLLGVQSPVTEDLLRAAAPGYCTPLERGRAPGDWFEQAIRYAVEPLLGATAPLSSVNTGDLMGDNGSYRVADYLVQHAAPTQRATPPPSTFWQACALHLEDDADALRVGVGAVRRQRFGDAIPLLGRAAEAGIASAMYDLAHLYARLGDQDAVDEVMSGLAASGEPLAGFYEAELTAERGSVGDLLDLAESGNDHAAALLVERGDPALAISLLLDDIKLDDVDALERFATLNDMETLKRLATLLYEEGEIGKAITMLELMFRLGCDEEVEFFAELLQEDNRLEELYELVELGYFCAARCLADKLAARGAVDRALDILRDFARLGDMETDDFLAHVLADHGRLDELLAQANAGDVRAAVPAAELLHARGELDAAVRLLVPLADAGEVYASWSLAELLAKSGMQEDLRARADAGDIRAAEALADLLMSEGQIAPAIELMRLAGSEASSRMIEKIVETLTHHGDVDQAIEVLWTKANSGDGYWTYRLAKLLKEHGREDELRVRIDMGDDGAAHQLYDLWVEQGRTQDARRLMAFGLTAEGVIAGDPRAAEGDGE